MKPKKQTSVKQMILGAIFFAFFAGFQTAVGIEYLSSQRSQLRWLAYFATAFGFCVVAAKFGLDLLRAQANSDESAPHSQ